MVKPELNLGVDPELLEQAAHLGISVAGLSERDLRLHLQKVDPKGAEDRARRWAEENAEALAAYRDRIERDGPFGDDLRTW